MSIEETNQTESQAIGVLQPELLTIAETSGMVLTEAQAIGSKFAPFMNTVNSISAQINELKGHEITPELAKIARKLRLELVSNRGKNGLLEIKEELKAGLLVRTRLIDKYVGVVEESSKLSEIAAEAIEKHSERIEAERLNKVYNDRVLLLEPYGEVNKFIDLRQMDEVTFANFLADTKLAFETRKENERKAEQERIDAEKKAEEDRIAKEKEEEELRLKKEYLIKERTKKLTDSGITFDGELFFVGDHGVVSLCELHEKTDEIFDRLLNSGIKRVEAIKAERERIEQENEKLRLEKEAKEKELVKEREIQAEKDRLAKIEQDKKDAEIKRFKDELEAEKKRLQQIENDRIAKEEALKNADDKEKVKAFFSEFDLLVKKFPELKSEPGISMTKRINEAFAVVRKLIIEDSKTLL